MISKLRSIFRGGVWQYIISFTSIVIILIIVMGLYLYNYYYNTIYKDFVITNKDYLSTVATKHETDIATINKIALQFAISDSITPFKLREEAEKSLRLQKEIKQYLIVSQFYNQMYLGFQIDDYLYNDVTSVHIDRFLDVGLLFSDITKHDFYDLIYNSDSLRVLTEQTVTGNLSRSKKAVIYFVPIQPGNTGSLLFIVGNSYYDELLSSNPEELRSTYIMKDGQVISSRGNRSLDESFVANYVASMDPEEYEEVKIDNQKYLFAVKKGENGFDYCTVQSLEIFQRKIFSSQWGVVFFILLCSFPAAFLVVILSRRLNRSIGDIKNLLNSDDSGGNDFASIQSGIRELVGDNRKLSEIAKESVFIRRSEMIRSFVRGSYQDRTSVIEDGKKLGLSLDKRYYMVVLMGSRRNVNDNNIMDVLLQLLSQEEQVSGYGVELISHEQLLFVIFAEEADKLDYTIKQLNETGKKLYDNFVTATSALHEDVGEITQAYLEANTAYDNRFLRGNSDILRFSELASMEHNTPMPSIYVAALKNALRMGDKQAVDNAISRIFQYIRSTKQSLFSFRILYNEIIHVLVHEWKLENIEYQRIYNIFVLSKCLSIQDLDDMLRDVCRMLLEGKKAEMETVDDKMQRAVDYMRENFGDINLNMNALAEHLSISTVMLSVEFKETMGMSPSDYLMLLRIDRAKELLMETNWSVKEICSEVGFNDVPGFIRRFKKFTGKTPSQFREA